MVEALLVFARGVGSCVEGAGGVARREVPSRVWSEQAVGGPVGSQPARLLANGPKIGGGRRDAHPRRRGRRRRRARAASSLGRQSEGMGVWLTCGFACLRRPVHRPVRRACTRLALVVRWCCAPIQLRLCRARSRRGMRHARRDYLARHRILGLRVVWTWSRLGWVGAGDGGRARTRKVRLRERMNKKSVGHPATRQRMGGALFRGTVGAAAAGRVWGWATQAWRRQRPVVGRHEFMVAASLSTHRHALLAAWHNTLHRLLRRP